MKKQYIFGFIIFFMMGNALFLSTGSIHSLSPIIDISSPTIHAAIGHAFSLVYFVLDDDPWIYELRQDNLTLARGVLETRRLEFVINYIPLGEYNYTLIVQDYSGNIANNTIKVIVSEEIETTSAYTSGVPSPGFESLIVFLSIVFYYGYRRYRRDKR